MFRISSTIAFSPSYAVPNISNSTLNPLESALPQNQTSPSANPIESTPFFQFAQFSTDFAPATPAFTTLTKHTPRNPIRMNTYTKHQVALPHASISTNSYNTLYRKTRTTRSCHFPRSTPSHTSPLPRAKNKSNLSPNSSSIHALRIRSGRLAEEHHLRQIHRGRPPTAAASAGPPRKSGNHEKENSVGNFSHRGNRGSSCEYLVGQKSRGANRRAAELSDARQSRLAGPALDAAGTRLVLPRRPGHANLWHSLRMVKVC